MTISGRKSVKKGQKMTRKATNLVYKAFSNLFFVLANLKYINGCNMMKKKLVSLHKFRTYFFPLGEVNASFLNLLTRANNYRKILSDFFFANKALGIVHWHAEIRRKLLILCTESSKKFDINCHF
jgi:hypothetical protein